MSAISFYTYVRELWCVCALLHKCIYSICTVHHDKLFTVLCLIHGRLCTLHSFREKHDIMVTKIRRIIAQNVYLMLLLLWAHTVAGSHTVSGLANVIS